MKHIMLNLETMANTYNAAIVSIGAVLFDEVTILDRFYYTVDLQSCLDVGLTVDASTIVWWLQQNEEAKKELYNIYHKACIKGACENFNTWWTGIKNDYLPFKEDIFIWGYGSTFDNVILRNAYNKAGIEPVWEYRDDLCYRTICRLFPFIKYIEEPIIKHHALHDAEAQAKHLIKVFNELRTVYNINLFAK